MWDPLNTFPTLFKKGVKMISNHFILFYKIFFILECLKCFSLQRSQMTCLVPYFLNDPVMAHSEHSALTR